MVALKTYKPTFDPSELLAIANRYGGNLFTVGNEDLDFNKKLEEERGAQELDRADRYKDQVRDAAESGAAVKDIYDIAGKAALEFGDLDNYEKLIKGSEDRALKEQLQEQAETTDNLEDLIEKAQRTLLGQGRVEEAARLRPKPNKTFNIGGVRYSEDADGNIEEVFRFPEKEGTARRERAPKFVDVYDTTTLQKRRVNMNDPFAAGNLSASEMAYKDLPDAIKQLIQADIVRKYKSAQNAQQPEAKVQAGPVPTPTPIIEQLKQIYDQAVPQKRRVIRRAVP